MMGLSAGVSSLAAQAETGRAAAMQTASSNVNSFLVCFMVEFSFHPYGLSNLQIPTR